MASGLLFKRLSVADGIKTGCEQTAARDSAMKRQAVLPFVRTRMDPEAKRFVNAEIDALSTGWAHLATRKDRHVWHSLPSPRMEGHRF